MDVIESEGPAQRALERALASFVQGVPISVRPSAVGVSASRLFELADQVAKTSPLRIEIDWRGDGLVFIDG